LALPPLPLLSLLVSLLLVSLLLLLLLLEELPLLRLRLRAGLPCFGSCAGSAAAAACCCCSASLAAAAASAAAARAAAFWAASCAILTSFIDSIRTCTKHNTQYRHSVAHCQHVCTRADC
jgi:hypothetical protein